MSFAANRYPLAPAIVLSALAVAVIACADSPPTDGVRQGNDAEMTAPADVAGAASRSGHRLQTRNAQEWVGVAHNKMLNDFRSELRKPGLLSRNICEYVTAFSMSAERIPPGRSVSTDENWRAVRAVADSSRLCSSLRTVRLSSLRMGAPYSSVAPPMPQEASAASLALFAEIETAISTSTDARDLASRLLPVLDRAASFPEIERAIIEATVSVAMNSYSYWQDQYPLFEQEMIAEYTPCIEEQLALGITDGITDSCFTGKGAGGAVAALQRPGKQRLVRTPMRPLCGPSIREGFKKIGTADAKGAFTGGFAGALAGGLAGAVAGALAGGGGNSIFAAGENAWQTLKCMYGMT